MLAQSSGKEKEEVWKKMSWQKMASNCFSNCLAVVVLFLLHAILYIFHYNKFQSMCVSIIISIV